MGFGAAENNRSACFDWLNFIRTGIKYEILVHILLFGLALFVKFLILTYMYLFTNISTVLYLINFKQVNRFTARGCVSPRSNLSFRVFVGASNVLNAKEKISMLKIEIYKNKSNMKINKKTMTKINNGNGGKDKEEKSKYM